MNSCTPGFIYFAAVYAVAVYDWILLLPQEYSRMWKPLITRTRSISAIEPCYFMARYYTLIALAIVMKAFWVVKMPDQCGNWKLAIPLLCAISTWFCDLIFALRCYAIWGRSKAIGVAVGLVWIAEIACQTIGVTHYRALPVLTGAPGPCIAVSSLDGKPNLSLFSWVTPLAFSTVCFTLTMIKTVQICRRSGSTTFLNQFIKDGVIYVLVLFLIYLLNVVFFLQPNVEIQALHAPAAFLLPSVAASRMTIGLRRPYSPQIVPGAVISPVSSGPSRGAPTSSTSMFSDSTSKTIEFPMNNFDSHLEEGQTVDFERGSMPRRWIDNKGENTSKYEGVQVSVTVEKEVVGDQEKDAARSAESDVVEIKLNN